MLTDFLPFPIPFNSTAIAGALLWALALYLGFSPVGHWVTEQINRWLNFAEQFLYLSQAELERTRPGWESRNAFYASVLSVIPFIILGTLCNYGVKAGLGESWSISGGMIACITCGVYELGRRSGDNNDHPD